MIPVCLGKCVISVCTKDQNANKCSIVGGGLFVGVAHYYMFLHNGGTEGTSVGAPGFLGRIMTRARGADQVSDSSLDGTEITTVHGRGEKMV